MRFEQFIKKEKLEKILSEKDWKFDISLLVTEARLHAGLTQGELAKKMKTKQPSIARVESGKMLPSLEFLDKLAEAIGTKLVTPHFAFMESNQLDNVVYIDSMSSKTEKESPYCNVIQSIALKSETSTEKVDSLVKNSKDKYYAHTS